MGISLKRYYRIVVATLLGLSFLAIATSAYAQQLSSSPVKTKISSSKPTSNKNSEGTWAGYAADYGKYTFASGYWNVPCIVAGSQAGHESSWVGIGGNNNLVQI